MREYPATVTRHLCKNLLVGCVPYKKGLQMFDGWLVNDEFITLEFVCVLSC